MSELRETAKFIDAGEFVDWLTDLYGEERITERIGVSGGARWSRRWFHWRKETATGLIDVHKVDEFIRDVFMGDLFLSDVPDCCFTTSERTWTRNGEEVRRDAVTALRSGGKPLEVAQRLGVSPSTVQKWARAA